MLRDSITEIKTLRFDKKLTLQELGDKFGVSIQRVEQLLKELCGSTGGSLIEKIEKRCRNCNIIFSFINKSVVIVVLKAQGILPKFIKLTSSNL